VPMAIGTLILALVAVSLGGLPELGGPGPDRPVPSPPPADADSVPSAGAAKAGCAAADKLNMDRLRFRKAVSCLHDLERHKRGLRSLHWNHDLARAAGEHARDMVRRHYFEHLSPGHRDHMDRIAAGGYNTSRCWSAGENLFFSHGTSTPRQLVRAWMKSRAHRRNILRGRWHDLGVGVVTSSPYAEPGGLTVVALFGARRSCR
jgi:uncharacterized protein YkwD